MGVGTSLGLILLQWHGARKTAFPMRGLEVAAALADEPWQVQRARGKGKCKSKGKSEEVKSKARGEPGAGDGGFVCEWADCRAGKQGHCTDGSQASCFSCLRPKVPALAPPVESMSERAFKAKLKAKEGLEAKGKAKGKGKSSGKTGKADTPKGEPGAGS